jgi:uncharacterized tellurite resistance protein B-like protein
MPEANYYLEQMYGLDRLPPRESLVQYGKAILIIVGADGTITEREQKRWNAIAASMGVPDDVSAEWRKFDWRGGRLEDCVAGISADPENPGEIVLAFLYDAIRVAHADGYDEKEKAAVGRAARTLGISPSAVASLEHLVGMEERLQELRVSLLYPGTTRFHTGKANAGFR